MSKQVLSPTRDEHFLRINTTHEQLAKALLQMPPRKPEEWEYMRKKPRVNQHQGDLGSKQ